MFEARFARDPHSRALGILPRTLEIFRTWGIYERFISEGVLRTKVDFWVVGQTKPVAEVDLSVFARLSAVPGILILPQNRTEALLAEATRATGLTEALLGHKVVSFEQDTNGVSVEVAGPNGAAQNYHKINVILVATALIAPYAILLAGSCRERLILLGCCWPISASGMKGINSLGRALHLSEGMFWQLCATRPNIGASYRHSRKMKPSRLRWSSSAIDQRVNQLFGAGSHEHLWSSVFQIHCRTSPHFRRERVLLAGDAGHINSPAGGQGMNSGIHDAHNLAWKLARVLAGAEAEPLLASYEVERREAVIKNVGRYTDFLTRFGLLAPGFVQKAVRALVRAGPRLGLIAHFAPRIGMLDTAYRRSPLVSGSGAWIGRRAPDGDLIAPDGSSVRLLDLAGPQPVLLLFDDGKLPSWDVPRVAQFFTNIRDLKIVIFSSSDDSQTARCLPRRVEWVSVELMGGQRRGCCAAASRRTCRLDGSSSFSGRN